MYKYIYMCLKVGPLWLLTAHRKHATVALLHLQKPAYTVAAGIL